MTGHISFVHSVAFSVDGRRLSQRGRYHPGLEHGDSPPARRPARGSNGGPYRSDLQRRVQPRRQNPRVSQRRRNARFWSNRAVSFCAHRLCDYIGPSHARQLWAQRRAVYPPLEAPTPAIPTLYLAAIAWSRSISGETGERCGFGGARGGGAQLLDECVRVGWGEDGEEPSGVGSDVPVGMMFVTRHVDGVAGLAAQPSDTRSDFASPWAAPAPPYLTCPWLGRGGFRVPRNGVAPYFWRAPDHGVDGPREFGRERTPPGAFLATAARSASWCRG
jgi:hypothetical protein